jgi:hypothetical protein
MMNRLVKSSPVQPAVAANQDTLPASSGRIPLAQAQGSPAASAVDGGHEVENPDPLSREHGVEGAGELACTIPDQELD